MAKRRFLCLLAVILYVLSLCSPAFASDKTLIAQTSSPASTVVYANVWVVQTFKLNQSARLNSIELYLMKSGAITGLFIGIYEWNTTITNLGKKLYSQNFTTLPTSYTITKFDYSQSVSLKANVQYAILLIPIGGTPGNTNDFIGFRMDTANPYPNGQRYASSNQGSSWIPYDTQDLYFVLYGSWVTNPVSIVVQFLPVIVMLMCLGMAIALMKKIG